MAPSRQSITFAAIVVLLAVPLSDSSRSEESSCAQLNALTLPNTTITLADVVGAGAFAAPSTGGRPPAVPFSDLPPFCRVAATLRPSEDSDIKTEVWLPTSNWNGKFMAVGNGGFSGAIAYNAMGVPLARGYAVASTNTGHDSAGDDASWALGHPEKQIDFGYRAVHEMTMRAKAIVNAFYARAPRYAYWNGCSSGGKQGLKEAQQFPEDYNGIVAGAPANFWTHLMTQILWTANAVRRDPASAIPPAMYPLIHDAVMKQCDAGDGVKDGLLEDPRTCQFDPRVLQCRNAETSRCLTAPQVEALTRVYGPARNPRTGEPIYPGLSVGSELGWGDLPQPFGIADSHYKYVVFGNPMWKFTTMNFDADVETADAIDAKIGHFNAIDPDLSAFRRRGGKLLQYHGWSDQQIAAENSINYYQAVATRTGQDVTNFYRLFMVPGMMHCRGGEGATDQFDTIAAIEQWVEHDVAPQRLIASHTINGVVDRTRPICPYPQIASYTGKGNSDDATSFVCRVP